MWSHLCQPTADTVLAFDIKDSIPINVILLMSAVTVVASNIKDYVPINAILLMSADTVLDADITDSISILFLCCVIYETVGMRYSNIK